MRLERPPALPTKTSRRPCSNPAAKTKGYELAKPYYLGVHVRRGEQVENGVLTIDDPRIERKAHALAALLGVTVEEAVFIALERDEARLLAEK